MNIMKKTVTSFTLTAMVLAGCAGREANPVQVIQTNDATMSCKELRQEISISQNQLQRLLGDQQDVQSKNTAAAVAGAIVFFPALFFLNLKGAAREEAKALQDRIVGLADRHNNKGCTPKVEIKPVEEADTPAE